MEEEKLVPLYGRGKTSTDPRSKSIPGVNIPNRPAGQRPETAPPPEPNHFGQHGFGFMGGLGGFAPMATARLGNFTFSAAFGGLIPSLFNLQVHGFPDAAIYGLASFPYGFNSFHGGHPHGYRQHHGQGQHDYYLKKSDGKGLRRNNDVNESKSGKVAGKISFIDLAGSERGADTIDNDRQTRYPLSEPYSSSLLLL